MIAKLWKQRARKAGSSKADCKYRAFNSQVQLIVTGCRLYAAAAKIIRREAASSVVQRLWRTIGECGGAWHDISITIIFSAMLDFRDASDEPINSELGVPRWLFSGLVSTWLASKMSFGLLASFLHFLRWKSLLCRKIPTISFFWQLCKRFVINAILDRRSHSDVGKIWGMRDSK